ncbi:hypothetical protein LCGC14_2256500 [marine sediment metagenome]|uniref:Uncharacterized protein n=1 Tax=marine sediment metagenome TaxID=412755 RepID=A0A0F9FDI8_9ZZZZ
MPPARYITDIGSLDDNAIEDGIRKALELTITLEHNTVILHLPTKNHLRFLTPILGESTIRDLKRSNSSRFNDVIFNLKTQSIEISDWTEDVVFSLYPKGRMLDNLNDLNRARAIIVVPWTDDDRQSYITTWNPEIISGDENEAEDLGLDPRIEAALQALTIMINVSTGLTYSSDKDSAIQLLRIIHQRGIELKPDEMKTWALQHGWTSDGANSLEEYSQGVLDGRRYRTGNVSMWNESYINELLE